MALRERLEGMPVEKLEEMKAGMEQEVADNDMMLAEAETAAPQGDFSAAKLNTMVGALNAVLEQMPQVPEYPEFSEDIEVFPQEFVDAIEMVNQVASDVGLDDMVIDITVIGDDKDLTAAAGQLKALASSREFKQMLKQMPGKTDLAAPVEEAPPAGPPEEEIDNMMMMRM
jgi:hypothetical protein